METKLEELYQKKDMVHGKAAQILETQKVPSAMKNEYNNKVSQYDEMYENVESMKLLSTNQETIDNLLKQQLEILTVRINWELRWMKNVLGYISKQQKKSVDNNYVGTSIIQGWSFAQQNSFCFQVHKLEGKNE